jgi:hypothetical protein
MILSNRGRNSLEAFYEAAVYEPLRTPYAIVVANGVRYDLVHQSRRSISSHLYVMNTIFIYG